MHYLPPLPLFVILSVITFGIVIGTQSVHDNHGTSTSSQGYNLYLMSYRPLSPHRLFSLSQPQSDPNVPPSNNSSPRLSFLYHTHSRVQHLWSDQDKGGWVRFDHDWGVQEWVDHVDALHWETVWIGKHAYCTKKSSNLGLDNDPITSVNESWRSVSPHEFTHIVRMKVSNLKRIASTILGMVWTVELPFQCESVSILNNSFLSSKNFKKDESLWLKMDCQKEYYVRIRPLNAKSHGEFHASGSLIPEKHLWKINEHFQRNMFMEYNRIIYEMDRNKRKTPSKTIGSIDDRVESHSNLIQLQYLVNPKLQNNVELEMVFFSGESIPDPDILLEDDISTIDKYCNKLWDLDSFSKMRKDRELEFDEKFERIFPVMEKLGKSYMKLARYALSNMLGTIGYFYGDAKHITERVDPATGREIVESVGPFSLLSAVPCRTKFPRGFLWDEGFHQLLIRKWDPNLSKSIISNWYSLTDKDGWIPREQILGDEARSFVPPEFVPQNPQHANPPTLFFVLEKFIDENLQSTPIVVSVEGSQSQQVAMDTNLHSSESQESSTSFHPNFQFVKNIFPNLKRHYDWFLRTQKGELEGSYRWRGRQTNHTLSSGLDDYPRGTFEPQSSERHLDLYCWIYMMTRTMKKYSEFLGHKEEMSQYMKRLSDMEKNFDKYHFSSKLQWYSDFVSTSESILNNNMTLSDGYSKHLGYVSLFPIISGLVNIHHPRYKTGLKVIRSSKMGIWSAHGLRSLSSNDSLYGQAENYWRGPIWINLNYLVIRALHENMNAVQNTQIDEVEGNLVEEDLGKMKKAGQVKENQTQALLRQTRNVYQQLRKNIIKTVSQSFNKKQTLHEQYDGDDGAAKGTSPFTGWTSLIINILGESY